MKKLHSLVLSFFLVLTTCLPASSFSLQGMQIPCMTKDEFLPIWTTFNETVKGWGIAANGFVAVFSSNDETHTWTQFMLLPSGEICVLANGTDMTDDVKSVEDLLLPSSN